MTVRMELVPKIRPCPHASPLLKNLVVNGESANGNGNGPLPSPRTVGLGVCLRQERGWVSCLLPTATMVMMEAIPPRQQLHGRRRQQRRPRRRGRRQEVRRMSGKGEHQTGRRKIPGAGDKRERSGGERERGSLSRGQRGGFANSCAVAKVCVRRTKTVSA